jgi:hypothetical protein
MINVAASVLSCMAGVERTVEVLGMNAEAIAQAGGSSR